MATTLYGIKNCELFLLEEPSWMEGYLLMAITLYGIRSCKRC